MPYFTALPFELKRMIVGYFIDDLLDEARKQSWKKDRHMITHTFVDWLMPRFRQQADKLLDLYPEMKLDVLAQCRKRGAELGSEHRTPDQTWWEWEREQSASEVAFRLDWYIWTKNNDYVRYTLRPRRSARANKYAS